LGDVRCNTGIPQHACDKRLILDYTFFVPTIYRESPYRFFFNSREESRMHVHI